MPRIIRPTVAVVVAGAAAFSLTGIAGAAAPSHSGAIKFFSVSIDNGKPADVVTGAISDHGTDRSVNNSIQRIVLSKGSFDVDAAKFNKSFKFKTDTKGCTAVATGSAANLAISNGTGAYAGISGSINVKATYAETGIVKNGKCQDLQGKASASVSSFSGTGHVSY